MVANFRYVNFEFYQVIEPDHLRTNDHSSISKKGLDH